jgi:transposase
MKKIQTKKLKFVNDKTLIATVDIGKGLNMGYYRCPDHSEIKPFEFANNRAGFDTFWNRLVEARDAKGLDNIVVGFESTGAYGEPLQHFLKSKQVQLVQVNPMHTKRVKELQGNSPNKTDRKDPRVIADIIALGHSLTVVIPEGAAAELRRLTLARERANKRCTALYNQLQDLIFISFPEFLQIIKDVKTKTARHLLQFYPDPQDIIAVGMESLGAVVKRVSRGKMDPAKTKDLFDAARMSAGIVEGRFSVGLEIQATLEAIAAIDAFVVRLEEEMSHHLEEIPYSHLLLSMKGIGRVTAAGLIGEVGDFNSFDTQRELLKHAGFDLFEISSGKLRGSRRISKRGRPLLRKLLFFAALNTVRKGGVMYEHYQKHLKKGMKKIKALVAIARKLLGIIFALVRTKREYQEDYQKIQVAASMPMAA